ncbi:MAG: DUF3052 domain-containing protein [bacterium]|nr:DUF3052 domain-containing protein [bacterium]
MTVGYSGRPLVAKLGIKDGFRIAVLSAPENYWGLLGSLPSGVEKSESMRGAAFDLIHLFVRGSADLNRRLASCRRKIVSNGMIWVSWPKKTSGVKTDLDGNRVRHSILKSGLVDIKVCAVDETWLGLKAVIPVKDRK